MLEKSNTIHPMPLEDDQTLTGRMREAAAGLRARGRGSLRLTLGVLDAVRSLGRRAEALLAAGLDGGEALKRLAQDGRLLEACAVKARADGVKGLPMCGSSARILKAADALCGSGEMKLSEERILLALAAFDDAQPLEMAELWAFPEAARVSLCRTAMETGNAILALGRERRLAERWTEGDRIRLGGRAPAFFEHALRLLAEREDAQRRTALERCLANHGTTAERVVREAHEAESMAMMRLENVLSAKRLLDALRWQDCFRALCGAERELQCDPSGVYPAMEEDSQSEVRAQLAILSRRTNVPELTLARHAVRAAQAASEGGEPEARRTVCWWLCDDAGRAMLARRAGAAAARLPKVTPDPDGRRTALGVSILAVAAYGVYLALVPGLWFMGMGIPLAWCAAMMLLGRVMPRFARPVKLLKLKLDRVPDEWRTLIVMPVLLSSQRRAEEICDQVESLSCMEKDENIQYLILGDFSDAESEVMPGDEAILRAVRDRVGAMNRRAGRERVLYLHRPRKLLKVDARWMGRDRKRGALMDLNRLILNENGAEDAFAAEGAACGSIAGRFRCVLTLDADTRFLPGTAQRLIGAMAHPMNTPRVENGVRRGYAVLQPAMEMAASACVNGFVRVFSGNGGLNTYPGSVSNLWQDVTGTGIYGGKGLYEVRAFAGALDGSLPEGRILSHDLIEGTLAGAALVSDVTFYDGFPARLSAFQRRLNRWIRGDWQLLPILLSGKRYPPDNERLGAAARIRMLDNLMRSLWAPSLLGLLIQAVWLGRPDALLAGLILAYWTPILRPTDWEGWRRATAELAILPVTAACAVDAVVRTLYRLVVSGKHLLDWVTSADAEGSSGDTLLPGRLAAILLTPGLLVPGWELTAAAMMVLFLSGPYWIRDMEGRLTESVRPVRERAMLTELARDIWRFFETYVNEEGHFLPPDNVQIDPATGAAMRTSPTNIGLYLMSCLAARELGFLSGEAMSRRMSDTLDSIEQMEKWNGQLYNWYDISTLSPLEPRYVSSVDSGNLAAALLLCASGAEEDPALSERMRKLAEGMNLSALFDEERELFYVGADAVRGVPGDAHYDLLASESRILSFAAIMMGQVPVRHWTKLSRAAAVTERGPALASWSGTMFEYLMPELFMTAPANALLGQTALHAVAAQRALGARLGRPWGVSESGYCAFDLRLNYQYRAFGLRALALGGQAQENVVAPYASILALTRDPAGAVKNIDRMQKLGWRGEYGFFEAADYLHGGDAPRLVRSYMAHHQGMALCSLCNHLTERSLARAFERIPEARAVALLLEERPLKRVRGARVSEESPVERRMDRMDRDDRPFRAERRLMETHLLGGADASALVTADGMIHYRRFGVQATRSQADLKEGGAAVYVRRERTGETAILGGQGTFYPGLAEFRTGMDGPNCTLRVCVSPEDGALIQQVILTNPGRMDEAVRVAGCAPVSLDSPAHALAHPVFRHLFVESERPDRHTLITRRRAREGEESWPAMVHLACTPGTVACETDLERLMGRMGEIQQPLQGSAGSPVNPCSALETVVTVPAGGETRLHFALGLTREQDLSAWMARNHAAALPERAIQLSTMQARAMLGFIGLTPRRAGLLHRLSAILFDPRLAAAETRPSERGGASREMLWPLGISGDLPILLVKANRREELHAVREAVRMHEFYRALNVRADLVLVSGQEEGYEQPVRDALSEAVTCTHLNDLRGQPGGVHILEGRRVSPEQWIALRRAAALEMDAGREMDAQLRRVLLSLNRPRKPAVPMELGENRLPSLKAENGFGTFLADGRYAIDVRPDHIPPAPWSNIMANDDFGILLTERGGGFIWSGNSRSSRLTAFANDALREGWGWMLYLVNEDTGAFARLLPGERPAAPFRVIYGPAETVYRFETEKLSCETALCVCPDSPEVRIHTTLRGGEGGKFRLVGFVDWLMGTDARDAKLVRTWSEDGACFAAGASGQIGFFASSNARVRPGCGRTAFLGGGSIQRPDGLNEEPRRSEGWVLSVPLILRENVPQRFDWTVGAADSAEQAAGRVRAFCAKPDYEAVRTSALGAWKRRRENLTVETPDANVNRMANGWLLHQTLSARVRGRTGLYQPGGAFGFRDQLQDMLSLLSYDPARVRAHILLSAARQFEDGDVMHWWHAPMQGVRTRIADDLLFLPYVTAKYVRWTGEKSILSEKVPYLENVDILPGQEDRYCEMRPGATVESLHEHCMRAFRRADRQGAHGLALMGGGDWNDGMNRVGAQGQGESVWLSEFLSACAGEYAKVCADGEERVWLLSLSDRMSAAVEKHGWDGEWYLRAYYDSGAPLGGKDGPSCRIDAISQAWAVLAGLDGDRCRRAMGAAWEQLADEDAGILRLLTPPFGREGENPGYIASYPAGVRENGAQYTHAACWLLLALIVQGDGERAHRALQMLLPMNHSDTEEKAKVYKVEPYVLAADVYAGEHPGRGGWTWYTGSASWLQICILAMLGFEREGHRVRMGALLGEWPEVSVTLPFGEARYHLVSRKGADGITLDGQPVDGEWIAMEDDGEIHEAVFPPRAPLKSESRRDQPVSQIAGI